MKLKLKAAVAMTVATAFAGTGLLVGAAPAFAANNPPWEPDANAAPPYGNIQFFDTNGVVVTSGSITSQPFAYAVATTGENATAGGTKATVFFRDPASSGSTPPASWAGPQESLATTFNPASSLTTAGAPATVAADAANGSNGTPVAKMNAAASNDTVAFWAAHNTADPNAAYDNIIDVVMQTSGGNGGNLNTSTYWSTDIGFNTNPAGGSNITVAGLSIPPQTWMQLFPANSTPATPTLVITKTGVNTPGTQETLSATNVPTSPPGDVVFEDNGVAIDTTTASGGTASFGPITPGNGAHSYTASFVPVPTSESGANTVNATLVGSSTSAPQTTTIANTTGVTLSVNPNTISQGSSTTLSSTVSESDSPTTTGLTGTVTWYNGAPGAGGTVISSAATTPSTTMVSFQDSSFTQGSYNIYAVYVPQDSTDYTSSQAGPMPLTVGAPPICNSPSVCTDTQDLSVTINPGAITISTPYNGPGNGGAFTLPAMTLSSDGSYFQTSATFPSTSLPNSQQIVVTSSLAPAYAWTVSVSATNLTDPPNYSSSSPCTPQNFCIPASGIGFTDPAGTGLLNPNGSGTGEYPGSVSFTPIPAHNPSPLSLDHDTNSGLTNSQQNWAHSTAADGTAVMDADLSILASTATPSGTYTGTITFMVS